jgi:hypothetical protein
VCAVGNHAPLPEFDGGAGREVEQTCRPYSRRCARPEPLAQPTDRRRAMRASVAAPHGSTVVPTDWGNGEIGAHSKRPPDAVESMPGMRARRLSVTSKPNESGVASISLIASKCSITCSPRKHMASGWDFPSGAGRSKIIIIGFR